MVLRSSSRSSSPATAHAAPGRTARTAPHRVRIIGGQWKRTPLPVADAAGLRPTPDRVRETVFNWLAHRLGDFGDRSFLDLFAGTGALGWEAASRGAGRVVLVERQARLVEALRQTQARLGASAVEIVTGDALAVLGRWQAAFDVVFLDPPFGEGWLERVWPGVEAAAKPEGLVYVEAEAAFAAPPGWAVWRHDRAGAVHFHLLVRAA